MPCFNFVVETDAAKPRSIFRGGAVSLAIEAKENPASGALVAFGGLAELTAGVPTVACVGASPGAVDDASVCGLCFPCVRAFGSLVDLCMFIGVAVWVFRGAKFEVLRETNLARLTV